MNNKFFAILLAAVIILGGIIIWYNTSQNQNNGNSILQSDNQTQSASSPTSSPVSSIGTSSQPQDAFDAAKNPTKDHFVVLSNDDFNPSRIEINKGETVKFLNLSDGKMWIASDPHPTHTDYPGFDQLTSVPKGGKFEFKFDRVGTWGFHNHLNPNRKGTVVVK